MKKQVHAYFENISRTLVLPLEIFQELNQSRGSLKYFHLSTSGYFTNLTTLKKKIQNTIPGVCLQRQKWLTTHRRDYPRRQSKIIVPRVLKEGGLECLNL